MRGKIDSRFKRPWNKDRNKLDHKRFVFMFMALEGAIGDLNWFHEQRGLRYCPGCQDPPIVCRCHVLCRCGRRHLRYAWCQGYSCHLRDWQPSVFVGEFNKRKSRFSWLFEAGWLRLFIPPFASELSSLRTTHEQRQKQNRELHFSSAELGLLEGAAATTPLRPSFLKSGFGGRFKPLLWHKADH